MCEPTQSITQFPAGDDDQGNASPSEMRPAIAHGLRDFFSNMKKGAVDWLKRIGHFYHFSRFGSGHHESLAWAGSNHMYLPRQTLYECAWWDRSVRVDGSYQIDWLLRDNLSAEEVHRLQSEIQKDALEAATAYAWRTSIGSLHLLRTFLEVSLRQTTRHWQYVEAFAQSMLLAKGRDQLMQKLARLVAAKSLDLWSVSNAVRTSFGKDQAALPVDRLIKTVLGFTRKRELLVPEWADDPRVWSPAAIVT